MKKTLKRLLCLLVLVPLGALGLEFCNYPNNSPCSDGHVTRGTCENGNQWIISFSNGQSYDHCYLIGLGQGHLGCVTEYDNGFYCEWVIETIDCNGNPTWDTDGNSFETYPSHPDTSKPVCGNG